MNVTVLTGIAILGFGSFILQKVLDVAGLQSFSQMVNVAAVGGAVATVLGIIIKVLSELSKLG